MAVVLSFMVRRRGAKGQLFTWGNGWFLMRDKFARCLRVALEGTGYPASRFAGHSFRIGTATTAGRSGVSESLIKTLGR